jgi:hypothetical protein
LYGYHIQGSSSSRVIGFHHVDSVKYKCHKNACKIKDDEKKGLFFIEKFTGTSEEHELRQTNEGDSQKDGIEPGRMNHFRIHLHPGQQELQNAGACEAVSAENIEKYQVKEIAVYKGDPVSFI